MVSFVNVMKSSSYDAVVCEVQRNAVQKTKSGFRSEIDSRFPFGRHWSVLCRTRGPFYFVVGVIEKS